MDGWSWSIFTVRYISVGTVSKYSTAKYTWSVQRGVSGLSGRGLSSLPSFRNTQMLFESSVNWLKSSQLGWSISTTHVLRSPTTVAFTFRFVQPFPSMFRILTWTFIFVCSIKLPLLALLLLFFLDSSSDDRHLCSWRDAAWRESNRVLNLFSISR